MVEEATNIPNPDIVGEEYASSLADLTVNSKPLINMLTMLAEENIDSAASIVKVIEKHLSQVKPEMKLPVLYLVDSIVKNIGAAYTTLFTQNIVNTFCSVFEKVDESTRASMFKLRQTWVDVLPPKKLYALDLRVKSIDPAWPITAPPPTSIHLNPAFLPKGETAAPTKTKPVAQPTEKDETEMRESLLKKKQELLELQRKKKEIEQLQEKARLQQQQIQQIQALQPVETKLQEERTVETSMDICVPEPMEIAQTPPPEASIEIITPISPGDRHITPEKKGDSRRDKKDRMDKDKGGKDSARKRSRKEVEDPRYRKDPTRKGKEPPGATEAGKTDDEVIVVGQRQANMREAAKSMPRIPKLSQRNPPSSSGASGPRDPRLTTQKHANQGHSGSKVVKAEHNGGGGGGKKSIAPASEDDVQVLAAFRRGRSSNSSRHNKRSHSPGNQAERRKMEVPKKEAVTEAKKRRTNRFDDLFGNEDIDLRKAPAPLAVNPTPGVAIPQQLGGGSPPRSGWGPSKRGAGPPGPRGRGAWPGRGGGAGRPRGPQDEDSQDGSGSPRNMDFIVEQAKENHRNGVISDGEYSTIIRQVFQMSETKMIREAQRRDSFMGPPGPPHPDVDFRYHGPPELFQEPCWNDPRRGPGGFGPYPRPDRMQRFDMMPGGRPPPGPPGKGPFNAAFEVRPDDDMKTIPIDNVPREIRFYGDQAVILMADDDPRSLGFAPGVRRVFLDNVTVDLNIGNDYVDFHFDGQIRKIKIGAPTRELYIDGNWYECMFGGPPITINLCGRPVQASLEGPPPTVKFGMERRLDLLAGRVTMIIDAHSVVPVYLDLKLQHFEMGGRVFSLQFQDSLRGVIIDGQTYPVNFGGLPMPINLDGRQHFARFSSLPRGVEPGMVLQPVVHHAEDVAMRKEDEKPAVTSSPLDIGELLSKLVATGLLPGAVPETTKTAVVKEEPKKEEVVVKTINLSDSESMKVRNSAFIGFLYSGMQCGSCGLRFPADQTLRYSTHLDWHFRQNRREKGAAKRPQSRKWYTSQSDWIQFEETEASEEKRLNWFEAQAKEKSEKEGDHNGGASTPDECPSVAVGSAPEDNKCFVCHEDLDQFYHEENEEWHLRNAVRVEGITFHHSCYQDYSKKEVSDAYSPSDAYLNNDQSDSGDDQEESEVERTTSEEERMNSADEEEKKHTEKNFKFDGFNSENSASLDTDAAFMTKEENHVDASFNPVDQESLPGIPSSDHEDSHQTPVIKQEPMELQADEQTKEQYCLEAETKVKEEEEYQPSLREDESQVKIKEEELHSVFSETPTDITETINSAEALEGEPAAPIDSSESVVKSETDTNRNLTIPSKEEDKHNINQDAFIPDISTDPLYNVNQTPALVTTLDGNVEMIAKKEPTSAPGFKIKINLFNKSSAASSTVERTQPEETAAPSLNISEGPGVNADNVIIPPPDEVALTNKPRLVGRQLTVLPPMKRGEETSGLCSIM